MAQIIRYVDPDAAGAGTGVDWANAYTSLSAWVTGEAQDLTDGGGDYMTVYCRSSGGTADTTAVTINGFTTSAACYIEIIGTDFPADGVYDNTAYRLECTEANVITVSDSFIYFRKLQIQVTATTAAARCFNFTGTGGTPVWYIDSCILKGVCSGVGSAHGVRVYENASTINIYNTTIYGFVSGSDTGFVGVYAQWGTINLYNTTIYDCYWGVYADGTGTVVATNCAVGNCANDFNGTNLTVDYCCSDDGDGNHAQNPSGGSWANEFNDAGNGDFSLKSGGNCVENGTDNPGSGLYSDDIIDTARSSTWDIGAYEYVPTTTSTTSTTTTFTTSSTTTTATASTTSSSTTTTATASTTSSSTTTTATASTTSSSTTTTATASTSSSSTSTTATASTTTTSSTSSTTTSSSSSTSTASTSSSSSTSSTSTSTASTSSSSTSTSSSTSSSSTSTTTTYGGSIWVRCETAVRNLTSQVTILTYQNDGTDVLLLQGVVILGDGSNDLDGTGGEFELTLMFGDNTNQPDPQLITFSSATRASVFTEQFPLSIGETVTLKIKSPNAADTSVYVHACVYEVGVESIRDELTALIVQRRNVTYVSDESGGSSGVYPTRTGGGTGVSPSRC